MIYVVEVPAEGEPRAWFAFDEADFARKVESADALQPWEIFDRSTPRELLDLTDRTPESPDARSACPGICLLGDTHGWDTPLFRADYLQGRGHYQPEPVTEVQACLAALQCRLKQVAVYWSDTEAVAAFEAARDAVYAGPGGWRARHALREQLLALEVLADDL